MNKFQLEALGAKWYHSGDYDSPTLSKASLGLFFYEVLSSGAYIGSIWPFQPSYSRSPVYVTVFMTEDMKNKIEERTRFRFKDPPVVDLA